MRNPVAKYINQDLLNTGMFYVTRMFIGFLSILFLPFFISQQVQGYWYTFGSLSAMSVLADLGFTTIVIQFAAHEYAFVTKNQNGFLEGEPKNIFRLFSFFRFVVKRSLFIVSISFPIILLIGIYVLQSDGHLHFFEWIIPWIIFILSSGLFFFLNLIASFFEGCDSIAIIQKQRNNCLIINWAIIYSLLFLGFELYALSFGMLFSSIVLGYQIQKRFRIQIMQIRAEWKKSDTNWNLEVTPLLWKYALSFIGGFLMIQIFTPIAFRAYGSVFSGQVGISMTLILALFQIANIWIYIIIPRLNILVSQNDILQLFSLFRRNFFLSLLTFFIIGCIALIALSSMPNNFSSRFLPFNILCPLLIVWFFHLIINSLATLSRAYKVEKFVLPSIVMGIYSAVSTVLIAIYLPSEYFFWGYFSSYFFTVPWFCLIYFRHKRKILSDFKKIQI